MGKSQSAPVLTLDPHTIREQLSRLLQSAHFRNSKRCQSLLKYVVEEAVSGNYSQLKERTIGVQVFGREPMYDTNQDAVVRNAAVEVRKRLAQYYMDPAHEHELRIDLPLGAYSPEFPAPAPPVPAEVPAPPLKVATVEDFEIAGSEITPTRIESKRIWNIAGLCAVLALTTAVGLAASHFWTRQENVELKKFWAPVLEAPEVAQICVGQPRRVFRFDGLRRQELNAKLLEPVQGLPTNISSAEIKPAGTDLLYFGDGYAMARVAAVLQASNKPYHLRNDSSTVFDDVRRSPLIVIGAFNNTWTMRLTSELRYSFASETLAGLNYNYILDRQNPNDRRWRIQASPAYATPEEDLLIVTRVLASATERAVVSVAGFGDRGTLAAGEFSTDAGYLHRAFGGVADGWESKNVQVVLRAKFIEGTPGAPTVLAVYVW